MQMPFGAGAHACLGQSLAFMEARVGVAMLARGFSVKVTQEPLFWVNLVGNKPNNGLPVLVTRK